MSYLKCSAYFARGKAVLILKNDSDTKVKVEQLLVADEEAGRMKPVLMNPLEVMGDGGEQRLDISLTLKELLATVNGASKIVRINIDIAPDETMSLLYKASVGDGELTSFSE